MLYRGDCRCKSDHVQFIELVKEYLFNLKQHQTRTKTSDGLGKLTTNVCARYELNT